jgi:hypothetical protein
MWQQSLLAYSWLWKSHSRALNRCASKVKLMVLGAKWFYKDCNAHAKDSCLMNGDCLFWRNYASLVGFMPYICNLVYRNLNLSWKDIKKSEICDWKWIAQLECNTFGISIMPWEHFVKAFVDELNGPTILVGG